MSEELSEPNLRVQSPFTITDSKKQTSPHPHGTCTRQPCYTPSQHLRRLNNMVRLCFRSLFSSHLGEGLCSLDTRSTSAEGRTRGKTRTQNLWTRKERKRQRQRERENVRERRRERGHSLPVLEYFHRR